MSESRPELVGQCYTRARLWPTVIGRMPGPGGGRLWGGPYTRQQGAMLVGSFLVLLFTQDVWARPGLSGLVMNLAVVVGVPYGLTLLVRRVEASGRSPVAVAGALVGLSTAPREGRMRGRPVRAGARPARRAVGLCTFGAGGGTGRSTAAVGVEVVELKKPSTGDVVSPSVARVAGRGGASESGAAPVLSGAQALVRAAREREGLR